MITQSLYLELQELLLADLSNHGVPLSEMVTEEQKGFIKPYMLIIHRPTKRGFYLDKDYRHIISVSNCQEPKAPIRGMGKYLGASPNLPAWVEKERVKGLTHCNNFDTFWLY